MTNYKLQNTNAAFKVKSLQRNIFRTPTHEQPSFRLQWTSSQSTESEVAQCTFYNVMFLSLNPLHSHRPTVLIEKYSSINFPIVVYIFPMIVWEPTQCL